jgi:hypothetical protein
LQQSILPGLEHFQTALTHPPPRGVFLVSDVQIFRASSKFTATGPCLELMHEYRDRPEKIY